MDIYLTFPYPQKVQKAGVERLLRAEVEDAAEKNVFTNSQQLWLPEQDQASHHSNMGSP